MALVIGSLTADGSVAINPECLARAKAQWSVQGTSAMLSTARPPCVEGVTKPSSGGFSFLGNSASLAVPVHRRAGFVDTWILSLCLRAGLRCVSAVSCSHRC